MEGKNLLLLWDLREKIRLGTCLETLGDLDSPGRSSLQRPPQPSVKVSLKWLENASKVADTPNDQESGQA